jgi:ribosomal protein S18 acetylase RimI-like enzyme
MIQIRELGPEELTLARAIDVSEEGTIVFKRAKDGLRRVPDEWARSQWDAKEWDEMIATWKSHLMCDVVLGAFDGGRLVGMGSIRCRLAGDTAQLTTLHVSRDHRRRGIARLLTEEIVRLARESGAADLYVSATPSESAVGFYLRLGFNPTDRVVKEAFDLEPDDIHMRMPLA